MVTQAGEELILILIPTLQNEAELLLQHRRL